MNTMGILVGTATAKALGWTLFHTLWEGAIAALVLLIVLCVTRSPRARHVWACAAMTGMAAAFVVTVGVQLSQSASGTAALTHSIPRLADASAEAGAGFPTPMRAEDVLPWLVPIWICGVSVFYLRALGGWLVARRLRRRGVCPAPDPWQRRLEQLGARLRMSKPVALLESCLAEVPVVVGCLRPAILLPVGMLAGLPAAHVDAILLHELAHIRRRDYLVNLLQTLVEGLLFYHPAVWWISSVIRTERENCCDDLAAGEKNVLEYAAALTALEMSRHTADGTALAATGGDLVSRIRRLLYGQKSPEVAPFVSAGLLTIILTGGLLAWQAATPKHAPQSTHSQAAASPYTRWLNEDVVYIITKEERGAFLKLTKDAEREHFVVQFWLRRDPTPDTTENEFKEEHYRRIAYANERFAAKIPGWKTDRGRIYITYGPPDEIESHPSGEPASGDVSRKTYPYEQWLYRYMEGIGKNVVVEFVDRNRTGDYRMTEDPNPGTAKKVVTHP